MNIKSSKALAVGLLFLCFSYGVAPASVSGYHENVLTAPTMAIAVGGESMWKDPCTHDGAAVGAGIVLQRWGMVIIGLWKAITLDKCF